MVSIDIDELVHGWHLLLFHGGPEREQGAFWRFLQRAGADRSVWLTLSHPYPATLERGDTPPVPWPVPQTPSTGRKSVLQRDLPTDAERMEGMGFPDVAVQDSTPRRSR